MRHQLTVLAAVRDDVLTLDGAAKLLDVCSKTVLTWHREYGLPAHRIGAVWRFLRSELVVWVEAQGESNVQ